MNRLGQIILVIGMSASLLIGCGMKENVDDMDEPDVTIEEDELVTEDESLVNISSLSSGDVTVELGKSIRSDNTLTVEYTALNRSDKGIVLGERLHLFWPDGQIVDTGLQRAYLNPNERETFTLEVTIPDSHQTMYWNLISGMTEDAKVEPLILVIE